jgi:hypothetical protein
MIMPPDTKTTRRVYPRFKRRIGHEKSGPPIQALPIDISRDMLIAHFHMPIAKAAHAFGVCQTAFKRVARELGVTHWPYRRLQHMNRMEDLVRVPPRTFSYATVAAAEAIHDEDEEDITNNINEEAAEFARMLLLMGCTKPHEVAARLSAYASKYNAFCEPPQEADSDDHYLYDDIIIAAPQLDEEAISTAFYDPFREEWEAFLRTLPAFY